MLKLWKYLETSRVTFFFVVLFWVLPIPYRVEMNWPFKIQLLIVLVLIIVALAIANAGAAT